MLVYLRVLSSALLPHWNLLFSTESIFRRALQGSKWDQLLDGLIRCWAAVMSVTQSLIKPCWLFKSTYECKELRWLSGIALSPLSHRPTIANLTTLKNLLLHHQNDFLCAVFAGGHWCLTCHFTLFFIPIRRPCRRSSRQRCWSIPWKGRWETRRTRWRWPRPASRRGHGGQMSSFAGTTPITGLVHCKCSQC